MEHKIRIFCDFDGTITVQDTWMAIGNHFIEDKEKWADVIVKFERLEIGSRECFLSEISLIRNFDLEVFNNLIDKQKLDEGFHEFYSFCQKSGIHLTILSEGMDYYIERILSREELTIPYYANKLILSDDNKNIGLDFPYSDEDCIMCGCCKRNLLLNKTPEDEISVYIGDGFSDACVSEYADIVFAKKSLASYCWKNNITYFEYTDFFDVKKKLEKILYHKKLKHRQTAKLKRREVYMRG